MTRTLRTKRLLISLLKRQRQRKGKGKGKGKGKVKERSKASLISVHVLSRTKKPLPLAFRFAFGLSQKFLISKSRGGGKLKCGKPWWNILLSNSKVLGAKIAFWNFPCPLRSLSNQRQRLAKKFAVRHNKRERERERESVCVCVCVNMYSHLKPDKNWRREKGRKGERRTFRRKRHAVRERYCNTAWCKN